MITPELLIPVVTFATVVAGFVYQFIREGRLHTWEVQQRQFEIAERTALAANAASTATALQMSNARVATELAERNAASASALAVQVATAHSHLEGLINANTNISENAFKEANSVNNKIASLGMQFRDPSK